MIDFGSLIGAELFKRAINKFLDFLAGLIGAENKDSSPEELPQILSDENNNCIESEDLPESISKNLTSKLKRILKAHNIPLICIGELFNLKEFSYSKLDDPNKFVDCFDYQLLAKICDIFYLNLDWLQGKKTLFNNVHSPKRCHKAIGDLVSFICNEIYSPHKALETCGFEVFFCLSSSQKFSTKELSSIRHLNETSETRFCIVVKITKRYGLQKIEFSTYQVFDHDMRWSYEGTRYTLKSIALLCLQWHTRINLISIDDDSFHALSMGDVIPAEIMEGHSGEIIYHRHFDFRDYAESYPHMNPEYDEMDDFKLEYQKSNYDQYERLYNFWEKNPQLHSVPVVPG